MSYISNCWYGFKFAQAFVAIIFLFLVFDNTKLCGQYVNQKSIQQAASIHQCSELMLYDLMPVPKNPKPVDFLKFPLDKLEHIQPASLPIGQHCVNISIDASRCFTSSMDPRQVIASRYALPVAFAFVYLGLLVVHVCSQMPPKYNTWQCMFAVFGVISWMITYMYMFILRFGWDSYWQCTNFWPQQPFFIDALVVFAFVLLQSCFYELLFSREIMNAGNNKKKEKSKALGPPPPVVNNNNKGSTAGGGATTTTNTTTNNTNNGADADAKKQTKTFRINIHRGGGSKATKESTTTTTTNMMNNNNNAAAVEVKKSESLTIAVRK